MSHQAVLQICEEEPMNDQSLDDDPYQIVHRVALPMPPPGRVAWATFGWVLSLTTIGGGLCGLVSVGVASLAYFFATIPVGMFLGAIVGLVIAAVLAVKFTRSAYPPDDPRKLDDDLRSLGEIIAGSVVFLLNLSIVIGVLVWWGPYAWAWAIAAVANGAAATALAIRIGRWWGTLVAGVHLRRFGLTSESPGPVLWIDPTQQRDPVWILEQVIDIAPHEQAQWNAFAARDLRRYGTR